MKFFTYIPPGSFMMGSTEAKKGVYSDEILHQVTLTRGFYMQTMQVTQWEWKMVMGNNPPRFKGYEDTCPAENVSWNDAQEFIKELNEMDEKHTYRLPTEAEWEYACRAGTTTPFAFGKCLSTDGANYDGNYPSKDCPKGNYRKRPIPVGSLKPNAWGLYDMHGNVSEWCEDWYGPYLTGSVVNPVGPESGSGRVCRGGSWESDALRCRSAFRDYHYPDHRGSCLGFRLVKMSK